MGKFLSRLQKRRKKQRKNISTSDPNLFSVKDHDPDGLLKQPTTLRRKDRFKRQYISEPDVNAFGIEITDDSLQVPVENDSEPVVAVDEQATNEGTLPIEQAIEIADDGEGNTAEEEKIFTDKLIVAAIDIGSAYSGYAFGLKEELKKDRSKMFCNKWKTDDGVYYKTSSSILFSPDKSFSKFGFEAESFYTENKEELANDQNLEERDISTWYYFQHFKMLLYDRKEVMNKDMIIPDIKGKKMKAIHVFSAAIKYLKDHLLNELTKTCDSRSVFSNHDIQWVIIVPAIWDMMGKQFMRDAANEAGIKSEQLMLALEPEAASLYCRQVPILTSRSGKPTTKNLEEGSSYIVLDQGGGTIDICIHQVLSDNCLKEIYQATGGDWGGNLVNKRFIEYLSDQLGKNVMEWIIQFHPSDYAKVVNAFERKKRYFGVETEEKDKDVVISIPPTYLEHYKNVNKQDYSGVLKIKHGRIYLSKNVFKEFFQESTTQIISHLEHILECEKLSDVKTILAVGGFSESPVVMETIRAAFPNIDVIVPNDAGLAVLKGAILFAFQPTSIKTRISRFTYGIKVEKELSENSGENYRRIRIDVRGNKYALDVFEKLVTIGDEITVGDLQSPREYDPIHDNQKHASIEFYATTEENPICVTDHGCIDIGTLEIDMSERDSSDGSLSLQINAGGTEISALVTDNETGKTFQGHFCIP